MYYAPCELGAVYPSLPKFSSRVADVEFSREIHAAKYVTAQKGEERARAGASPDKIKLLPAALADKAKI